MGRSCSEVERDGEGCGEEFGFQLHQHLRVSMEISEQTAELARGGAGLGKGIANAEDRTRKTQEVSQRRCAALRHLGLLAQEGW